jgi:hypothetical protein
MPRAPPAFVGQAAPPAARSSDGGGAVVHQIYVKVVTGADADKDATSRKITIQLLTYIHTQLRALKEMGVSTRVNKITSQNLKDHRLVAAMRARGILRLPAVTTPNNVYLGLGEIRQLYDRNIREHAAIIGRGEREIQGATGEEDDVFRTFYKDEMTFERAEDDTNEDELGEGKQDLGSLHRDMMNRREQLLSGRRPSAARTSRAPAPPPGRRGAPPPQAPEPPERGGRGGVPRAPAARAGNVAPPDDPEEASFTDLLDRLSRDIDDNVRTQAFAATDADDDDSGRPNPQDDLMERSFYANQVSSDTL